MLIVCWIAWCNFVCQSPTKTVILFRGPAWKYCWRYWKYGSILCWEGNESLWNHKHAQTPTFRNWHSGSFEVTDLLPNAQKYWCPMIWLKYVIINKNCWSFSLPTSLVKSYTCFVFQFYKVELEYCPSVTAFSNCCK